MSLILAIEPDRKQASRISALGRGTLDAELLVADSTEHGVAALKGRHPDLILTSLLLSPRDEAGLRDFERGGVPVPTLMIPVLAGSSRGSREGGGLFARLGRKASTPSHDVDGCDPAVFAAQIAEYLARVREEREAYEEEHQAHAFDEMEPKPLQAAVDAVASRSSFAEEFVSQPAEELLQPVEEFVAVDAVADEPAVLEEPLRDEPVVAEEPFAAVEAELPASASVAAMPVVDAVPREMPIVAAPVAASQASADSDWEEIVIVEHEDADHRVEVEDDFAIELSSESVDLQAFVDELKATYVDLFPVSEGSRANTLPEIPDFSSLEAAAEDGGSWEPTEQSEPPEPRRRLTIAHELPFLASWPSLEGIAAEDAPPFEYDDVVAEFVQALEEPENPRAAAADSDLWMPLSPAPGLAWPRLESTCSRRPPQDEWGFYDPDQYGLSAVVAKLNQVTR